MRHPIHIVTRLHGIGGAETHSFDLAQALNRQGILAKLWSESGSHFVDHFNATAINPYNGILPRGGTLVIVGTYFGVDPWIDHVRPQRLILVCVNSDPRQLYAMLANLDRPSLPSVELVYVSTRLKDTMGIPGRVCPEIVDLERFHPRSVINDRPFTIGRLSRDVPEKHHPQDVSLYRLLGWQGFRARIMGGTCLRQTVNNDPAIDLLAINQEKPEDFLQTLDVFFYRTAPTLHEASGRVIVEALASGCPIVAHASGGYTDWIAPRENGFIFSAQEEAYQLLTMLAGDVVMLRRLAEAARRSAERIAGPEARAAYFNWLSGLNA